MGARNGHEKGPVLIKHPAQASPLSQQLSPSKKVNDVPKVLFCGAGGTGKTTFLRCAREICGKSLSEMERLKYAPILRNNAIVAMTSVVEYSKLDATTLGNAYTILMESVPDDPPLACLAASFTLWANPLIRQVVREPAYVQLKCNGVEEKLFAMLPKMCEESWVPSVDDILVSRIRTTGIVEGDLKFSGQVFRTYDVGGQREERKKWIHCFEGLTAVVFFLAPGAFEEHLYEDAMTNKLAEDLQLWEEIAGSRWFVDLQMFVILNKMDRFPTQPRITLAQLQENCSLLSPLLSLILEYVGNGITSQQLSSLEESLQGTMYEGETPHEFLHRSVLSFRPSAVVIDCVSIDIDSVRSALQAIGERIEFTPTTPRSMSPSPQRIV